MSWSSSGFSRQPSTATLIPKTHLLTHGTANHCHGLEYEHGMEQSSTRFLLREFGALGAWTALRIILATNSSRGPRICAEHRLWRVQWSSTHSIGNNFVGVPLVLGMQVLPHRQVASEGEKFSQESRSKCQDIPDVYPEIGRSNRVLQEGQIFCRLRYAYIEEQGRDRSGEGVGLSRRSWLRPPSESKLNYYRQSGETGKFGNRRSVRLARAVSRLCPCDRGRRRAYIK